mmetsp:Transcript_24078/g.33665  ORF Transcript_24078/g.33665 Transcript_24078/m.33665 type:complete len:186 (+) Transcript_24078:457-1014(+)
MMVERATGAELTISVGPCKTCSLGCDTPHNCSIGSTSAVYLNRALQQKQLEIEHVGNIAGTMSKSRSSSKISKSEGDLNSINSLVTTRSKYTVKSEIEIRNGRPIIVSRNTGGIPFKERGGGVAGPAGYFKRKKKLLNKEKIENAKEKAVIKCIKNSFKTDLFKRQLAFWAEVDKIPFEELLLEV